MTFSVPRSLHSILLVALIASVLFAGLGSRGPADAPEAAGSLRASASAFSFLFESPANESLRGLSNPVIAIAVGWFDANPAVAVGAELYLDGMNLTSAGFLNASASTFTLPVGFAFRDGRHFVNFAVMDSVGSVGYHNWTFTVDTIPPVLVVTSPAYPMVPTPAVPVQGIALSALAAALPVTVTVTALPSHVSLSSLANTSTGAFSIVVPLSEGLNTLFVNATDAAGNLASDIVPIVSDTVKPRLVVLTPANLSVSPTDLVRVSGLSEFGAFVTVNGFSVIVAPNGTWSVVLALPEGLNILQIAAADQVGNINYTGLAVFVDSDVPQVVLTSPTAALTNQDRVVVSGTVTDTKVVALLVNGNPVTVHADGTFSTTLSLPEGLDPIVVVGVDAAQHVTTVRTAVRVDTTAPMITVSTPPDGLETNASAVVLRGTVDDLNSTVLVDDQMIRPDASGHWQTSVALLPGGNTVTVSAVDAAGNRAAATVIHITVFSPIPDLQNGTSSNALNLDQQAAVLRFSLVGIVLLFAGITFVLYSRTSRRLREDRLIIAALVRRLPPKR